MTIVDFYGKIFLDCARNLFQLVRTNSIPYIQQGHSDENSNHSNLSIPKDLGNRSMPALSRPPLGSVSGSQKKKLRMGAAPSPLSKSNC
jgi:hypothetical protein